MKSLDSKSVFDIKGLLIFSGISAILLVSNIIGWNKLVYSGLDNVFNPFIVFTREFASKVSVFSQEVTRKDSILTENIDLKRKMLDYHEVEAINKDLKDQIAKLQTQLSIEGPKERNLRLVNIVGAENIFSSRPQLIIRSGSKDGVKKNDPVFFSTNTLLGFVDEVYEDSSRVLPFYSPELKFKIPVQSAKDPAQKGFISSINNSTIKITNLPAQTQVYEGDLWITTNDVAEVPANLVIGKVKKVNREAQESFINVDIDVPFSLSQTLYVFVRN